MVAPVDKSSWDLNGLHIWAPRGPHMGVLAGCPSEGSRSGFFSNGVMYDALNCVGNTPDAGMGSSRTVLELEDSSRTQNRGLGL